MMISETHHHSLLHSGAGDADRDDGEAADGVFQLGDLSGADEDRAVGSSSPEGREVGLVGNALPSRPSHATPLCVVLILVHAFLQSYAWNGFVSILLVFSLVPRLSIAVEDAVATIHLFLGLTYLTSAMGGFFTDISPGKYKSMVIALILWVSGNLLIWIYDIVILSDDSQQYPHSYLFFIALLLIAFGRGIGTAANSSFLGDQLPTLSSSGSTPAKSGFNLFNCFIYVVTSGAVFGKFLSPWIRSHMDIAETIKGSLPVGSMVTDGSVLALGVIFIGLFFSHIALWCGYSYYVYLPVTPSRQNGMVIVWELITRKRKTLSIQGDDILYLDDQEASVLESITSLRKIIIALIPLPIFWALFYQMSSSWILQATTLEGIGIFGSFNHWVTPDQMQFFNPLLGLAFIPIGSYLVAPVVQRFRVLLGFERDRRILPSTHRMIVGMLFISLSFFAAAFLQKRIDENVPSSYNNHTNLSIMWQLPQYVLLTTGEVLFCIAGMEFIYSEAPSTMKTAIQSCWYMTIAIGNLLVAVLCFTGLFSFAPYSVTTTTRTTVSNAAQGVCNQYCMYIAYACAMLVSIFTFALIVWKYFPNATRRQRTSANRTRASS